jgi:biopolymer transport protein TolR
MAAQGGSEDNEISNINITPMVDIMLVLLVIFMVTANFLKKESININLPKVGASDPNVAQSLQVSMTKDGKILLEGAETSREKLIAKLAGEVKFRPNMRVTLSADEQLPYGNIAKVMGMIRKSGVSKIALSVKR